ncbi:VanZ family protein [Metaclostridioides mangenotii]|uniref:VanZ family protein n=1 Tax=Metaclostridioides mangenotii TaxID=1540 RepID=UPI0028F10573|nr:VanZ family protein [Clostridioides mangenotii]
MKDKDNNKTNKLTNVLFIIYLIALFWIIVFKFNVQFSYMGNMRSINLIPFSESLIINGKLHFSEIIMNVVIFLPLGIYVGILFKRWIIGKKLFLFFLISLICEGFQFILGVGASDITDIINNTLGGIIGLMIYKGIEKVFKNSDKAQKFMNIIAIIGTILMILLLLLLKINNLWIFRI